jgi:nucleotide-binding universal stress UspA family protein
MKMILVPLDFSDATASVVEEAARLAKAIDAHVILLHVVRLLTPVPRYSTERTNLAEAIRVTEAAAEEELERTKIDLCTRGIAVHTLRLTGNAATDIVEQAEKLDVDYIVMGSHGHTAFYDLVVGSTTSAVLRRSRRVVLVVPAPKKTTKSASRRRERGPRGRLDPQLAVRGKRASP